MIAGLPRSRTRLLARTKWGSFPRCSVARASRSETKATAVPQTRSVTIQRKTGGKCENPHRQGITEHRGRQFVGQPGKFAVRLNVRAGIWFRAMFRRCRVTSFLWSFQVSRAATGAGSKSRVPVRLATPCARLMGPSLPPSAPTDHPAVFRSPGSAGWKPARPDAPKEIPSTAGGTAPRFETLGSPTFAVVRGTLIELPRLSSVTGPASGSGEYGLASRGTNIGTRRRYSLY